MSASEAEIAAAAIACLPMASRAALRRLWEHSGHDPLAALDAVRTGAARGAGEEWSGAPARPDVDRVARVMARRNTRVLLPHDADWPLPADCPDPPAILFAEGAGFEALLRPSVSIVGTRAATPHGITDAHDLAVAVVRAGYTVVSGLAIGVDAAAHRGAIDGGGCTIGVVATGLDVVYPRRHVDLFAQVRAHGVVLGEYPFGTPPERWRFPTRNRLIAALGEACVVVEAKAQGGALSTAGHAMQIGRALLAMPGSRRNAAAAGTNELIRDGALPLLEPRDLFVALGLRAAASGPDGCGAGGAAGTHRASAVALSASAVAVQRACHGEAATIDQLLSRTALSTAAVAAALRELERVGAISRRGGRIWPA